MFVISNTLSSIECFCDFVPKLMMSQNFLISHEILTQCIFEEGLIEKTFSTYNSLSFISFASIYLKAKVGTFCIFSDLLSQTE